MKKNHIFMWIIILFPVMIKAQMNDSFSDGDFTSDPAWTGDAQEFKISSSQALQLNGSGGNTSYLSTSITSYGEMEWDFWIKQSFSPSDNNFGRVYLLSDQQNLEGALNGYFLRFGTSGSDDAIELLRQTGSSALSLCKGSPGAIAASFSARIKVTRSEAGEWKVFADYSGTADYKPEGTAVDLTFQEGGWFGVVCTYTSSNSSKFYFDDFYVGPVIVDTVKPLLETVTAVSFDTLKLKFSEAIDAASAANVSNYSADRELGTPASAIRDPEDPASVVLSYPAGFIPDQLYILTVENVQDLSGNRVDKTQLPFSRHQVHAFDILISEIMCNPTPQPSGINLEYIELFNRTGIPIDLTGWSLTIGTTMKVFPDVVLQGSDFLLLSDEEARPYLEPFAEVLGFSSLSLANAGNTLALHDADGRIIHTVCYSDTWYRNDYKKEGGWSLELIDPANPCGEAGNWIASNDPSGGTPGRVNSMKAENPDHQTPLISRIGVIDPLHIKVYFNEAMDSASMMNLSAYSIDQSIGSATELQMVRPGYKQVLLTLPQPILKGVIYNLSLLSSLLDCAGNPTHENARARFAIPEDIQVNNMIINEVLFNPKEGCVDFVEVLNRSMNVYDLSGLTLAELDTITMTLSSVSEIVPESYLVFPGEYYALCTDTAALRGCYTSPEADHYIQLERMPSMNDAEGSIALALKTGEIIDRMSYSEDMQYPLLVSKEGVSLERINPDGPGSERWNWHSAAENVGFGTPACKNSQFAADMDTGAEISIQPEIFSPDNDGKDDLLMIIYNLPDAGYCANVRIFDANGRLTRTLVNNRICGTSGTWIWDGINEKHLKAPIGRYVVHIELFDLKGNVRHFKKTAVLGAYLQ